MNLCREILLLCWKIYFDNQTRFDLAVFKDGENWFTIPSGKTELKKEFLSKKTLIEIRNGDQILESHEIKTQTGNTYVYNILNKSIYYIGQVTYASNDLQFALKSEQKNERRIEGVFFELFEVEYVFDAPPSEITVNSNGSSQSARKKYIRRVLRY